MSLTDPTFRTFRKPDLIDVLREVCDDLDSESFRDDYSGRGMYGHTCPGVVSDLDLIDFTATLYEVVTARGFKPRAVLLALGSTRSDSMGMNVIHYWPAVGRMDDDYIIDTQRIDPEPVTLHGPDTDDGKPWTDAHACLCGCPHSATLAAKLDAAEDRRAERPHYVVCDNCAPEWPCAKCQDAMTGSTFASNASPDYDALFASVER